MNGGMPHAQSIKPLDPGAFIADKCKLCGRKYAKGKR